MYRLARAVYKRVASALAVANGRRASRRRIAQLKPKRVLVLCYGNIYRSPFVESILQSRLTLEPGSYEVKSAGFHAKPGRPSDPDYVDMCAKFAVDLSGHRSAVVDSDMIDWADIIVVMDRHNWARLGDMNAAGLKKLVWVGAGKDCGSVEIEDPYRKDADLILATVTELVSAAEKLAILIRRAQ